MASVDLLFTLGNGLFRIIRPLEEGLESEQTFSRFLRGFGWDVSPSNFNIADVRAALPISTDLATALARLASIQTANEFPPLQIYLDLVAALERVVATLSGASGGAPPPGIPGEAWAAFTSELFDALLADDLAARHPGIYAVLLLAGIASEDEIDPAGAAGRLPYIRKVTSWDRLGALVTDPADLAREVYDWDQAGAALRFDVLLTRAVRAFGLLDFPAATTLPDPALLDEYYSAGNPTRPQVRELKLDLISGQDEGGSLDVSLFLLPIPERNDRDGPPRGLALRLALATTGTIPAEVLWPYSVALVGAGGRANFDGARLEMLPSGFQARLASPAQTTVDGAARLERADGTAVLIGSQFSHRLEVSAFAVDLAAKGPVADPDVVLGIELARARLVVDMSDADGFLSKALGTEPKVIEFSAALSWSSKTGFHFRGSGSIEVLVPLDLNIAGLLSVKALLLRGAVQNGTVTATAGVTGAIALGPVAASVEGVGVGVTLRPISAGQPAGVFGKLDFDFGFEPPRGVGISVDAGPVTGGGFLFFDEPNGRYGGALELKVYSVNVKAFGVIETRLPDGASGFSFAIVISAEFTPIQLGLGFTLNGVGGIIGINRRIDEEGLRGAVRTGALDNLLFPANVVENAPQIIHDLRAVLPAAEGRYVFGPMAKLGWGTPTLIEAKLGIILELPGPRLALLGEVAALLPKKDRGLVTLNMSIAGLLDFPRKFFALDASLHHSQVGGYPISGDMAMRLSWGDTPSFALAVGGFNPGFQPPPSFPALRRVAVDLGVSGNPSLTLQGYFAITSNTAQVGALCELNASGSGIRLYGRVQFDAIFVFSPFSFEAGLSAQVRVSFKGRGIGVHLRGVLSGPSPWRVRGEVCVSILFWDACLGFDKSFGSAARVELPGVNPWNGLDRNGVRTDTPALQDAVQDVRNWTAEPPPGSVAVVSLAAASAGEQPIDPLGAARLQQRVCPLEVKLQRFGALEALGPAKFDLETAVPAVVVNNTLNLERKDVRFVNEAFAPAQYFQMKDSEKLSSPSFQKLKGGFTVSPKKNNLASGSGRTNPVEYRTKVIGETTEQVTPLPVEHLEGMRKRSMTGLGGLRRLGVEAYVDPTRGPRFTVADELFVVADVATLAPRADVMLEGKSKIEAQLTLRAHVAGNPAAGADLQVVPRFEMAA